MVVHTSASKRQRTPLQLLSKNDATKKTSEEKQPSFQSNTNKVRYAQDNEEIFVVSKFTLQELSLYAPHKRTGRAGVLSVVGVAAGVGAIVSTTLDGDAEYGVTEGGPVCIEVTA